ncbi:D-tyrosyl-tRNA deacylase [Blastopirellula marina DSM 3645]|uniref:D-tyrosyl-tRNA deacylase n=1 Tax=Blastopirellula marina DSM 3645 TaxID=314230 RepID=A3ZQW2_9BACT|nr:D-tyrosyl-tRNA deacylase [Blastopirellula marina DSM 3645]
MEGTVKITEKHGRKASLPTMAKVQSIGSSNETRALDEGDFCVTVLWSGAPFFFSIRSSKPRRRL